MVLLTRYLILLSAIRSSRQRSESRLWSSNVILSKSISVTEALSGKLVTRFFVLCCSTLYGNARTWMAPHDAVERHECTSERQVALNSLSRSGGRSDERPSKIVPTVLEKSDITSVGRDA